jgi:hypothetical protein
MYSSFSHPLPLQDTLIFKILYVLVWDFGYKDLLFFTFLFLIGCLHIFSKYGTLPVWGWWFFWFHIQLGYVQFIHYVGADCCIVPNVVRVHSILNV